MAVAVRYKCRCMSEEAVIDIPFRPSNQDIAEWVGETVAEAISRDHHTRSPLCMATAMEYAKIPTPENAPYIGGRPVTN